MLTMRWLQLPLLLLKKLLMLLRQFNSPKMRNLNFFKNSKQQLIQYKNLLKTQLLKKLLLILRLSLKRHRHSERLREDTGNLLEREWMQPMMTMVKPVLNT
jgi:hypothetical protein